MWRCLGEGVPGAPAALSTLCAVSIPIVHPHSGREDSRCLTGTQMLQGLWVPASLEIPDLNSFSEACSPNYEKKSSLKSWVKEHVCVATGTLSGSKDGTVLLHKT